jgi:hypothetical protein
MGGPETSSEPEPEPEPDSVSTTPREATTGDGGSASASRETTGPPSEEPHTCFQPPEDSAAVGAATSEIKPEGSDGPTAWAKGAKKEGFCHDASRDENAAGGLISGCGSSTRWMGGTIRQSARTTGNGAERRRKGHTANHLPEPNPEPEPAEIRVLMRPISST